MGDRINMADKTNSPDESDHRPKRQMTHAHEAPTSTTPNPTKTPLPEMSDIINRAALRLEAECHIGFLRDKSAAARKMVIIDAAGLFAALVELYTKLFRSSYKDFRHAISPYYMDQQPAVNCQAAAENYISVWIHDLYVSNQNAFHALRLTGDQTKYDTERHYISDRYDPFLSILLAAIKPTIIHGSIEEMIFIPEFRTANFSGTASNPFNISSYDAKEVYLVQALLETMDKKQNNWRTIPISEHTFGRPSWLFDFQNTSAVYAWFPAEGNYTLDDVIIPYILGVKITDLMGPKDTDDWQQYANNVRPTQMVVTAATPRVNAREFNGSSEHRRVESRSIEEILNPANKASLAAARALLTKAQVTPDDPSISKSPYCFNLE